MPKIEVDENLKRPQSAYFLWINANRARIEEAAGSKNAGPFAKKAGEMWKTVPDNEKKALEEQYKAAKEKYDAYLKTEAGASAMNDLKTQRKEHEKSNLKKEAKKAAHGIEKDEKLKKPTTAYWLWMNANRSQIEEAAGSKSVGAVGKKAGEMWKELAAAAKKPFEDEAAMKKKAYDDYVSSEEGQAALAQYKMATKEAKEAILGEAKEPISGDRKRKAEDIAEDAEAVTSAEGNAKRKAGPKAKAKAKSKAATVENIDIPSTVLAKAEKAGMADKLQKLLSRDDIVAANISASKALSALETADGLFHPAKRALLGA